MKLVSHNGKLKNSQSIFHMGPWSASSNSWALLRAVPSSSALGHRQMPREQLMLTHCCSPCLGSFQTRSDWHKKAACAASHSAAPGHWAEAAECSNTNSPLRYRPAMHGCFWRTQLLVFAGYLQGTVQAFALQLYQALDLWESKILLSMQFFSQKEPFSCRCQECKTKPSDWCPAALVKGAWTRQSLFQRTEKMLPQSCWLVRAATWVGEMELQLLSKLGCHSQEKWLKAMNYWPDGSSQELLLALSHSAWRITEDSSKRIQPLSSHTPGPPDCSLSIRSIAGMVQQRPQ